MTLGDLVLRLDKRKWRILRDYAIGWTLALLFLSVVRGAGTVEMGRLRFDFFSSAVISLTIGPFVGFISGYSQLVSEERIYKRHSIQRFLLIRVILVILFLVIMVLIAYLTYDLYFGINLDLLSFAFDTGSFAIYAYFIAVDVLFGISRQVNLMMGEGNLAKLLRGKFYTPREEVIIFMFLDLQESTTIAERLGHIRYSKLIQDCFSDLGVVLESQAEIYQYVGDEAVLIWKHRDGVHHQQCLEAFYRFKQALISREAHYRKHYSCLPFFKAGVHGGLVTVTEVGRYKKEIAYHGDAVNTAARIQGQCNAFGKELLTSAELAASLDGGPYNFQPLGQVPLKGKKQAVEICAVALNEASVSA